MVLLLSLLCSLGSAYLLYDRFLLEGALYARLPQFSATAAALVGLVIAGMEYRARKTKKQRRAPMALLLLNACFGIIATGLWLYALLLQ